MPGFNYAIDGSGNLNKEWFKNHCNNNCGECDGEGTITWQIDEGESMITACPSCFPKNQHMREVRDRFSRC